METTTTSQEDINMNTEEFTVTEFRTRMRSLIDQLHRMDGGKGGKVDLQVREIPVAYDHFPSEEELWVEGDDLFDFCKVNDPKDYLQREGHLRHGACIHVQTYQPGQWGELLNQFIVWMGTPDQPAEIAEAPGFERSDDGTWQRIPWQPKGRW